jgi:hypothetical protein
MFEHLVDQQYPSALTIEIACKIGNAASLKIKVVHVDVQAAVFPSVKILFGVLQQKCGLAPLRACP